jgi:hypothetical protein
MFEMLFLGVRLKAIKNSALICEANPFSGEDEYGNFFSLNQMTRARKNREMNKKWFFRNIKKLKQKFSTEKYESIANDLGINIVQLNEIEYRLGL